MFTWLKNIFLLSIIVILFPACSIIPWTNPDPDHNGFSDVPFNVQINNTVIKSIAISEDGMVYATGTTNNPNLGGGEGGVFNDEFSGNGSCFIVKYSPDGEYLRGTYLATGNGEGIAINSDGNIIIGGATHDLNWPTENAFQPEYHPGSASNCFMTKLGPGLKKMYYSTYIGGGSNHPGDSGFGSSVKTVRIDSDDNAYFIASSQDNDYPLGESGKSIMGLPDAPNYSVWPMTCAYGCNMRPPVWSRVIVGKLSPDGDYEGINIGGREPDTTSGPLAVDHNGNIYIGARFKLGGELRFCTTLGAYRTEAYQSNQSYFDCAVSKINSDFDDLVYSTYLGGHDQNNMMTGDVKDGCFIIAGMTRAGDFPVVNPIQHSNNGDYDWTVTKMSVDGKYLEWSTYLGTRGYDSPSELRIDEDGRVWIVGLMNGRGTLIRISSDLQRTEEWRDIGGSSARCLDLGDGCVVYSISDGHNSWLIKEMR